MSAVVFYDMDAECFVYLKNMYTKVCAKMTETPGAFPWEQNKRTIVYGENGPVNSYALMKSTENNTDYFIYQMTINYATVSKIAHTVSVQPMRQISTRLHSTASLMNTPL